LLVAVSDVIFGGRELGHVKVREDYDATAANPVIVYLLPEPPL
jgi:hypothetical protein